MGPKREQTLKCHTLFRTLIAMLIFDICFLLLFTKVNPPRVIALQIPNNHIFQRLGTIVSRRELYNHSRSTNYSRKY